MEIKCYNIILFVLIKLMRFKQYIFINEKFDLKGTNRYIK